MYHIPFTELEEKTLKELGEALDTGKLTSRQLVEMYQERIQAIDQAGPTLRSVLEINPDALTIADTLDEERRKKGPRGPLHGIPILLKDNIATADRMETTAGSLALLGSQPVRDAFVAQKLRVAGAIILGKANMSEWANFRSSTSSSGWSGRGGQALNPYVLDRSPCGSSSGSATAVAANLAAASLGSETDGSILCPAAVSGVVGIKPTVGLTSRAGIIPISHSQDTIGPFGRTVEDAAILLGAIAGADKRDPATQNSAARFFSDYTQFLDRDGLKGARIGIARQFYTGYSPKIDAAFETCIKQIREAGAIIVDPADIPTAKQMGDSQNEMTVLRFELKADLNAYLAGLKSSPVRTLAEIIAFNEEHASEELLYFGQEHFLEAQKTSSLNDPGYIVALAENQRWARQEGIDAVMDKYQLDALLTPTTSPSCRIDLVNGDFFGGSSSQPAALAGYPAINVPAGFIFNLPIGITFTGRAYSEATLIKLAYAFEQATKARRAPAYLATTP
ncbi:MAG TPA: amidase [Ktedonobacteraceae bacterium]|nr:amidase [Ktedonobacteraceae bacterium]